MPKSTSGLPRAGLSAHLEAAGEAEGKLCGVLEGAREVAEGGWQVQLGQVRHSRRLKVVAPLRSRLGVSFSERMDKARKIDIQHYTPLYQLTHCSRVLYKQPPAFLS